MPAPIYQNPFQWSFKVIRRLVIGIVAALFVIILIGMAITIVGPGERGILIQLGNMQGIFGPGLHFKIPVIQNVVTIDVRTQKEQVQVDAASKDLQSIRTLVALNYHVDPARVDSLYQEIGVQYVERIIDPAIQESVKAATAQFTAEELITKRPTVKEEIKAKLVERLSKTYIEIDDFSIVDFTFSDSFNAAIEAKQTAVQQALKAENDLKRIEIEAQQQIEKAKADAESIRIQGDALKENQGLVQLKFVEKWDGVLPTYVMGSNVPLLNMLPTASS
jgi:regulator of protease activity HflC (stomatin/prohibitin superfamily)